MPINNTGYRRMVVVTPTAAQMRAINEYVMGHITASEAARQSNMKRQSFVNLVFSMLPQWFAEGRILGE